MNSQKSLFPAICFLFCIALLTASDTFAQKADRLKLKPTDGNLDASVKSQAYYYPEFKSGKVSFINGISSTSSLNYNMLSGEVEFISSKKDTLALADIHYVKMITIEADTFYYDQKDQALLKLVMGANGNKLLVKERYELTDIKNVGAFGIESSSTSPNSSSRNQVLGNSQNKLKQNETLVYSLKSDYYFADEDRFVPANKANALKLSPTHKKAVQEYIKENKTSFNSEEQLINLLKYVASL